MTEMSPEARKIIYRCTHRGTRELDLMLGSFARAHVPTMSDAILAEFAAFTELPEPDLAEMMTGKRAFPSRLSAPLRGILESFHFEPTAR